VPGEWSSFIADNARFFTRPVASGSDASVVLGVGFGPVGAVPPSYDRTER
jgi:hypothetical protein